MAPSNLPSTKKKLDIRDYLGKIEKVLPTSAGEIVMILVTLCLYREENSRTIYQGDSRGACVRSHDPHDEVGIPPGIQDYK